MSRTSDMKKEWQVTNPVEYDPTLEWLATINHKFIPNLVHYPLYFSNPSINITKVPVTWSGCFPGFSISMKNTGSAGTTSIEIYIDSVLTRIVDIIFDNSAYQKIEYVTMNSLLSPGNELEVRITSVATDAEDLKIDLHEITFPFELEISALGNIQNNIEYNGRNREHLFLSSDYWTIELNQPILSVDYVKVIDTNGQELPITAILEGGYFYNSRIRIAPYTSGIVDHLRIRVQDAFEVFHVLKVKPITTFYMSDFPESAAVKLISFESGILDITGTGTASATNVSGGAAAKAVDNISNLTSYWATAPSTNNPVGLPQSWAYNFGLGNEKIISKIRIKAYDNIIGQYLKYFEIYGSNVVAPVLTTDADWEGISSGEMTDNPAFQEFEFDNDTAYRWYRIKIKTNYRSDAETGIGNFDAGIDELEMFERLYTYDSTITRDCWLGSKYYRYSFDAGSNWTSWLEIPDTQRIILDFTGKITATYPMLVQYQIGNNVVQDSFNVLFAAGEVDASVQYFGDTAKLSYVDEVPFNRAEVYYDDVLSKTIIPVIYNGFGSIVTNTGLKKVTVAAGIVYYQDKKYDWAGTDYILQPDFSSFDVMFRLLFGFNTKTNSFEFKETINETPGQPVIEKIPDFTVLWVIEYSVTTLAADFSSYNVTFSTTASLVPEAIVPIEVIDDRKIDIRVYDIAGRYMHSIWTHTKTKYNIWRTLRVLAHPFMGSAYQVGTPPEYAIDNEASSFWTSPLAGPLPQWLKYAFGLANKKTIVEYTLRVRVADAAAKPTAWKLQGSNDNSTWIDVDAVTGYVFASDGPFTFTVDTPGSYAVYRLYITATSGGKYVQIREWELKDVVSGTDLIDPDAEIEVLPGEIHGFSLLDFIVESEKWNEPL
jgi:hypothetical protein